MLAGCPAESLVADVSHLAVALAAYVGLVGGVLLCMRHRQG